MNATQKYKNTSYKGSKVAKMDKDVYALRRRVINLIYDIKKVYPNLPRIEVRIVDAENVGYMGYAFNAINIVHIVREWANTKDENVFIHLILHEVVHAVTGFQHDDNCYLMNPYVNLKSDPKMAWKAFDKYMAEYK